MLDARIPLGVQPMQIEPRSNMLMRAAQLQGQQDQNALRQMQMAQIKAQAEEALKARAAQQAQQQQMDAYLASLSGRAGPPQPFNPMEAAGVFGIEGAKKLQDLVTPKASEGFTLTPGAVRFGPDGRQIAAAPVRQDDNLPQGMRMGANGPEWIPGYLEGRQRVAQAGATNVTTYGSPVPVQLPDGSIGYAQPSTKGNAPPKLMTGPDSAPLKKPGDSEKPLSEGQAKAVAFASRMRSADQTLAALSRKGVTTTIPGAMGNNATGSVVTALSSPEQQQLAQAKRDFVNAVLRRESGAVIADDEFKNAERQYFPQIGDSRQVIEQKAQNRRIAIEGMMADVPKNRRKEVDQIVGGGASEEADPLGLRGR